MFNCSEKQKGGQRNRSSALKSKERNEIVDEPGLTTLGEPRSTVAPESEEGSVPGTAGWGAGRHGSRHWRRLAAATGSNGTRRRGGATPPLRKPPPPAPRRAQPTGRGGGVSAASTPYAPRTHARTYAAASRVVPAPGALGAQGRLLSAGFLRALLVVTRACTSRPRERLEAVAGGGWRAALGMGSTKQRQPGK